MGKRKTRGNYFRTHDHTVVCCHQSVKQKKSKSQGGLQGSNVKSKTRERDLRVGI